MFANQPTLELRRESVRAALTAALAQLDARLPIAVPAWVDDRQLGGEQFHSTDPGEPTRIVGVAQSASVATVREAVAAAVRAAGEWAGRPVAERAATLRAAAGILRERRLGLAALEVRECAKPWVDADADVCEAIDFLEYYSQAVVDLRRELLQVPGERNELHYRPRGVTAVISPWNFPLAIPTGMTAAALVTGNAVLLKPAEQSPVCALELVRALRDGGVPAGVISLLPGAGDVGSALVGLDEVNTIAFTGSATVGAEILGRAAGTVKRVIAEMGGKNCVIVDSDADLDEAVPGIVASAFGYAGQKCSAAARVLAHHAIAEQLAERLAGAVELLVVGQAADLATQVPPLIERAARDRVDQCAALAAQSGTLLARVTEIPDVGWFSAPTLVADLPGDSELLREEIFGPLLTIETVGDVVEATEQIGQLPYALTGGLYARDPRVVRFVAERSPVGNLYVNRPITGAMVGRQPFGGNRLSGTGAQAGGPDYLLQFVDSQVVSENTLRHGLPM